MIRLLLDVHAQTRQMHDQATSESIAQAATLILALTLYAQNRCSRQKGCLILTLILTPVNLT